jgi:hypothetical protein
VPGIPEEVRNDGESRAEGSGWRGNKKPLGLPIIERQAQGFNCLCGSGRSSCLDALTIPVGGSWLPKPARYLLFVRLVGATGFEPATPWPPSKCSTKLSYAPTHQ